MDYYDSLHLKQRTMLYIIAARNLTPRDTLPAKEKLKVFQSRFSAVQLTTSTCVAQDFICHALQSENEESACSKQI